MAEPTSASAQGWCGCRPGWVCWHRWTQSHSWLTVLPQIIKILTVQKWGVCIISSGAVLIVWLHLHLLKSSADLDKLLFENICIDFLFCLSTRWLGNFTLFENELSINLWSNEQMFSVTLDHCSSYLCFFKCHSKYSWIHYKRVPFPRNCSRD